MIRIISLCLILAFSFPAYAEKQDKRSQIQVEAYSFDFGTVSEGTLVSHDFHLKNTGSSDFVIQDVISACGCTVGKSYSNVVAPGSSTTINVKFDTAGFSGNQTKAIQVLTNDLDKSSINLKLTGNVQSDVSVSPAKVFLGSVNISAIRNIAPQKISVRVSAGSTAEIDAITSESKAFEITDIAGDNREKSFVLKFSPNLSVGEVRDRIIVKINKSMKKSINIPVYLNVTKDFVVSPAVVSFGIISGTEPIKRSAKIENFSPKPIQIAGIESTESLVQTEIKTVEPGRSYILDITVDPKKVTKDLKSILSIKTSDEETGIIKLNVYGARAEQ